jgi:hypothetical protein
VVVGIPNDQARILAMTHLFSFAMDDLNIAGNTGWAGAGLLGLVLGWLLLKHLPDIERSRVTERDAYLSSLRDAQQRFDEALHQILDHCKEEMAVLMQAERE